MPDSVVLRPQGPRISDMPTWLFTSCQELEHWTCLPDMATSEPADMATYELQDMATSELQDMATYQPQDNGNSLAAGHGNSLAEELLEHEVLLGLLLLGCGRLGLPRCLAGLPAR